MSDCAECDQPMLWGGMQWVPHSNRQHAVTRMRLIRYAARLLRERVAVAAGHRVTLRFTANWAWFECACGEKGSRQPHSAYARGEAHDHLALEGGGR